MFVICSGKSSKFLVSVIGKLTATGTIDFLENSERDAAVLGLADSNLLDLTCFLGSRSF